MRHSLQKNSKSPLRTLTCIFVAGFGVMPSSIAPADTNSLVRALHASNLANCSAENSYRRSCLFPNGSRRLHSRERRGHCKLKRDLNCFQLQGNSSSRTRYAKTNEIKVRVLSNQYGLIVKSNLQETHSLELLPQDCDALCLLFPKSTDTVDEGSPSGPDCRQHLCER